MSDHLGTTLRKMGQYVTRSEIVAAAEALANLRGARSGMPPIKNILELLPKDLHDQVMEEAEVALLAVALLAKRLPDAPP